MRTIDISKLKRIGSGAFSIVYRLSSTRIIKVYNRHPKYDMGIIAEEIELSMISEYALPVLDIVIAKNKRFRYYAVIKEYLPYQATFDEIHEVTYLLPYKLREDCHEGNIRKNSKGKVYLIDTQGNYAFNRM